MNNYLPWDHWRGQPPGSGTPAHPTRQISDHPAVFEFARGTAASYPLWYDPSYWYEGVRPRFNLQQQIGAIETNLGEYGDLFFVRQAGLIAALVVLSMAGLGLRAAGRNLVDSWWLLVPALAAGGLYLLVYVEDRYAGPFVVLLWAGLLVSLRFRAGPGVSRLVTAAGAAAVVSLVIPVATASLPAVVQAATDIRWRRDSAPHPQWRIARSLQQMGLRPGDRVAHIGQALKSWSYWRTWPEYASWRKRGRERISGRRTMRLDRVFWRRWPARDAKAVIARRPEPRERPFDRPVSLPAGWRRIDGSSHYVFFLEPPDPRLAAGFAGNGRPGKERIPCQ